ncbi:MAG: lysophospholipid acyltransferase family protein [Bacteroidota bacterium]
MSYLLAFLRFLILALSVVLVILTTGLLNLFFGEKKQHGLWVRKQWARLMVFQLGVRVKVYGAPPQTSGLVVGNHRSYFDPVVLLCDMYAFPVAKSELASWPLIGWGAKVTGILFVERSNKVDRRRVLEQIGETLRAGFFVLNYAEGTTHDGPTTIDFRPASFAMAAAEGFPIVPVATDYKNIRDAWIGDDTFVRHFFECFGKWRTEVKISYGQSLQSDDQQYLLTTSKNWIDGQLLKFREEWQNADG